MNLATFGPIAVLVLSTGFFADDGRAEERSTATQQSCPGDSCLQGRDGDAAEKCGTCSGPITANKGKLCHACANAADRCYKCGLPLAMEGIKRVVIGALNLVDKQPHAKLTYYVLQGEDGSNGGVYVDPARLVVPAQKGRVVVRAYEDKGGAQTIIRELFVLGPAADDKSVSGTGDQAVHWRIGGIDGPEVQPKGGAYTLVLPAATKHSVDVVAGKKVLETWTFDGKA